MSINPAALGALAKGDIANALVASTPGGIEAQEARGQRDMASSFRTLPKDMDREAGQTFGFTYGEDDDDIFVTVTAPQGWSIRPTEHSMHSDIVDDQGRKRGGIFYKAAFYDRRADGNWLPRYRVESEYAADHDVVAQKAVDAATGEVLFREPVAADGGDKWERREAAEKVVRDALAARFPDYKDATAYWADV